MPKRMFVYELPYSVRLRLCQLLDACEKWEELGGEHMGCEYTYLQCLRRKPSPTDELLTIWGNKLHTVKELFVLLCKMQFYRAAILLKDLVEEKYHHLLRDGEEVMSQLVTNKTIIDPVNNNRADQRYYNYSGPSNVQGPPPMRFQATAPPPTDTKDLGVNIVNLNWGGPNYDNKASKKSVSEIKIQNVPQMKGQNVDQNYNIPNKSPIGYLPAVNNGNHSPLLELPGNQLPPQQRRSSNSSISEGALPLISYEALEAATNNWDPSTIIGKGGFGVVYKGNWQNITVAIKKLESQRPQKMQTSELNESQMMEALREIRHLNSYRHDHILSLYGFSHSDTHSASCLVYQYMDNGSLDECLHVKKILDWEQRLKVMSGTAKGIEFLHSLGDKPLVHGDIKSANILLDKHLEARLGDFGLAREGPLQQYTHIKVSRVHGTKPYLPDEFLRFREFSTRVDVYSYGVVLFEVATGLRAYDHNRKEKFLKNHVELYEGDLSNLVDRTAGGVNYCNSAEGLLRLGLGCVAKTVKLRPSMKSVLANIEKFCESYKLAQQAKCMARQNSLNPHTPLEMQILHDEMRVLSHQPTALPGSTRSSMPGPPQVIMRQAHPMYFPPQCVVETPTPQIPRHLPNPISPAPALKVVPPSNPNTGRCSPNLIPRYPPSPISPAPALKMTPPSIHNTGRGSLNPISNENTQCDNLPNLSVLGLDKQSPVRAGPSQEASTKVVHNNNQFPQPVLGGKQHPKQELSDSKVSQSIKQLSESVVSSKTSQSSQSTSSNSDSFNVSLPGSAHLPIMSDLGL